MKRVAVVALVLLAACSHSVTPRASQATATTTTTSTSTTTSTLPATTSTSLVLARPCSAADLGIALLSREGATGHISNDLRLQNLSATTCSLSDYPTGMSAMPTDGGGFMFQRGTFFPDPPAGNLAARACCGLVVIESSFACGDGNADTDRSYKEIRIGLPGGGNLSLGDIAISSNCELRISKLGIEPTH